MIKHLKWILLVPVLVFGAFWFLLQYKKVQQTPGALPQIAQLPVFEFRNQDGKEFSEKDFLGKVTVVNFIFTHCPTVCPLLTEQMKNISSELSAPEVQFVSISVDPENDTPAVLKKYAERFHADLSRWSFVTGPIDRVGEVVVKGFKIALLKSPKQGKQTAPEDLLDITHGEHFVLVDSQGYIRSYQMLQSELDKRQLLEQIHFLVSEVRN